MLNIVLHSMNLTHVLSRRRTCGLAFHVYKPSPPNLPHPTTLEDGTSSPPLVRAIILFTLPLPYVPAPSLQIHHLRLNNISQSYAPLLYLLRSDATPLPHHYCCCELHIHLLPPFVPSHPKQPKVSSKTSVSNICSIAQVTLKRHTPPPNSIYHSARLQVRVTLGLSSHYGV